MTLPNKTCQCVGLKENDVVLKASLDLSYPLFVTAIHLSVITRILFRKVPTSEFCAAKSLKPKLVSTPATKVCFQEFSTLHLKWCFQGTLHIQIFLFFHGFSWRTSCWIKKSNSTFLPFEMRRRKWKWRVLHLLHNFVLDLNDFWLNIF